MANTEYDEDNFEEIYPSYESKRIVPYKNEKNDFFKNEKNDIFQFDDDIFTKDKKDNFYSESSGSNFINPLKYDSKKQKVCHSLSEVMKGLTYGKKTSFSWKSSKCFK